MMMSLQQRNGVGHNLAAGEHPHQQFLGSYNDAMVDAAAAANKLNGIIPHLLNAGTVVSGAPESELTSNVSVSRKRSREVDSTIIPSLLLQQQQQQQLLQMGFRMSSSVLEINGGSVSTGVARQQSFEDGLLSRSSAMAAATTSASGRSPVSLPPHNSSPVAQDLVSLLYNQNNEIDALIRLQNEKLRSGLEEANRRHCRALVSIVDRQVRRRLAEKDAELESANRRNAELEEKIKQMGAENQIWFNVAKNNEAVVASLRSSLEQVLLLQQNSFVNNNENAAELLEEGYGDSDAVARRTPAAEGDAQSSCGGGDNGNGCRVCGEREACVLLLPCRHLCLCKGCEPGADTCPVCGSASNATIQVSMP